VRHVGHLRTFQKKWCRQSRNKNRYKQRNIKADPALAQPVAGYN